MICDNCGYDKNPDDAISCNLCGKVFRKEVRKEEEVKETYTQPMSKAKKFYAWWKEGIKEDAKRDPGGTGIIGLVNAIGKIINSIREMRNAKGKDLLDQIVVISTLIIAVLIGVYLAPKIGLEHAIDCWWRKDLPYVTTKQPQILGLLIIFIWLGLLFICFTLLKFIENFFLKRRNKKL